MQESKKERGSEEVRISSIAGSRDGVEEGFSCWFAPPEVGSIHADLLGTAKVGADSHAAPALADRQGSGTWDRFRTDAHRAVGTEPKWASRSLGARGTKRHKGICAGLAAVAWRRSSLPC